MLGLAVLVTLGLYVSLAKVVVKAVGKRTESTLVKYATIAVFILIPTWDIIPGQLYHQHLCKTEGGIQVFKMIEVDKAYFLPDGRPDEKKLFEVLNWQTTVDRDHSKLLHIAKYQGTLSDKQTGDLFGIATDFWYKGGWFMKLILPDALSTICPQYPKHTVSSSLWRVVVRPQSEAQSGGQ